MLCANARRQKSNGAATHRYSANENPARRKRRVVFRIESNLSKRIARVPMPRRQERRVTGWRIKPGATSGPSGMRAWQVEEARAPVIFALAGHGSDSSRRARRLLNSTASYGCLARGGDDMETDRRDQYISLAFVARGNSACCEEGKLFRKCIVVAYEARPKEAGCAAILLSSSASNIWRVPKSCIIS